MLLAWRVCQALESANKTSGDVGMQEAAQKMIKMISTYHDSLPHVVLLLRLEQCVRSGL